MDLSENILPTPSISSCMSQRNESQATDTTRYQKKTDIHITAAEGTIFLDR